MFRLEIPILALDGDPDLEDDFPPMPDRLEDDLEPAPTCRMTREEHQRWMERARRRAPVARDEDATITDRLTRDPRPAPSQGIMLIDEDPYPETTAELLSNRLFFEKIGNQRGIVWHGTSELGAVLDSREAALAIANKRQSHLGRSDAAPGAVAAVVDEQAIPRSSGVQVPSDETPTTPTPEPLPKPPPRLRPAWIAVVVIAGGVFLAAILSLFG